MAGAIRGPILDGARGQQRAAAVAAHVVGGVAARRRPEAAARGARLAVAVAALGDVGVVGAVVAVAAAGGGAAAAIAVAGGVGAGAGAGGVGGHVVAVGGAAVPVGCRCCLPEQKVACTHIRP